MLLFFSSTCILRKLLPQPWSHAEERWAGSRFLTCVQCCDSSRVYCWGGQGGRAAGGHSSFGAPKRGGICGWRDKRVSGIVSLGASGYKRNKGTHGLWEEGTWGWCSGLWSVGVCPLPVPTDLKPCPSFQISACFSRALSRFLTSQLPNPTTAKPAFSQQKPHSCLLYTCLRVVLLRLHPECGQSEFWKYVSSSKFIPSGNFVHWKIYD